MLQLTHWPAGEWPLLDEWTEPFLFVYSLSYVIAALVRVYCYRRDLRQRRGDSVVTTQAIAR